MIKYEILPINLVSMKPFFDLVSNQDIRVSDTWFSPFFDLVSLFFSLDLLSFAQALQ